MFLLKERIALKKTWDHQLFQDNNLINLMSQMMTVEIILKFFHGAQIDMDNWAWGSQFQVAVNNII